jgi:uncharacterized membrane protein YhhN
MASAGGRDMTNRVLGKTVRSAVRGESPAGSRGLGESVALAIAEGGRGRGAERRAPARAYTRTVPMSAAGDPGVRSTANDKAVFALAVALAYVYALLWAVHPYAGSTVLKVTPDVLLIGLALRLLRGRERVLGALAYLTAVGGDVCLDFGRAAYLKEALEFFLVSQACFTGLFLSRARWMPKRIPLLGLVVALAAPVVIVGWEAFGPMRAAVVVFVVGLVAMGWAGVLVPGNAMLGVGAVLWVIADLMIGINRFIAPRPYWTPIILTLYATAIHLLIGWGVLFRARPATAGS